MAPVARALEHFLRDRCTSSHVMLYADDLVIVASSAEILQAAMSFAFELLFSLDFEVNIQKSMVTAFGASEIPNIVLCEQAVPAQHNPDVLGSTITTARAALVSPNALPSSSSSRSVLRWMKVRDRLVRLSKLPVIYEAKEMLWRSLILPVVAYDCWALLPNSSTADTWSALVARSVYSAVRGHRDPALLAAQEPHQLDILSVFVHQLAKEALPYVWQDPLDEVFIDLHHNVFHTPISAFAKVMHTAGFSKQVEGLWHPDTGSLITWPPDSVEGCPHEIRVTLRKRCLARTKAKLDLLQGSLLCRKRCEPSKSLTRTQRNFLKTLQADAHRAKKEPCQLCDGPIGIEHAIWHCEARSLALALQEPAGAFVCPNHLRNYALVLDSDDFTDDFVTAIQEFVTKAPLDVAARAAKRKRRATAPGDDEAQEHEVEQHPEARSQLRSTQVHDTGVSVATETEHHAELHAPTLALQTHRPGESAGSGSIMIREGETRPTVPAGRTLEVAVPEVAEIIDDSDNEPVTIPHVDIQSERGTYQAGRAGKGRRWDISQLPAHIITVESDFSLRYRCTKCACMTAAQSRSDGRSSSPLTLSA
eukprot:932712-Amphidinium_carterae.1